MSPWPRSSPSRPRCLPPSLHRRLHRSPSRRTRAQLRAEPLPPIRISSLSSFPVVRAFLSVDSEACLEIEEVQGAGLDRDVDRVATRDPGAWAEAADHDG